MSTFLVEFRLYSYGKDSFAQLFIYIVYLNTLYETEHVFVTFLQFDKIIQSKYFKKLFWKLQK